MSELGNTWWRLTGFQEGNTITAPIEGTRLTAHFRAHDSMGGSGGCNTYFASYTTENHQISITDLGVTLMLCSKPPGRMEQEQRYLQGLLAVETFQVDRTNLTLSWGGGKGACKNALLFTTDEVQQYSAAV